MKISIELEVNDEIVEWLAACGKTHMLRQDFISDLVLRELSTQSMELSNGAKIRANFNSSAVASLENTLKCKSFLYQYEQNINGIFRL